MEEMKVTQIVKVEEGAEKIKTYIGTVPVKEAVAVVMLMLPAGMKVHKIEFDISPVPHPDYNISPVAMSMSTAPLPNHILYGKPVEIAGRACPLLMWIPAKYAIGKVETHITGGTELPEVEVKPGIMIFDEIGLSMGKLHKPTADDHVALTNLIQNLRH